MTDPLLAVFAALLVLTLGLAVLPETTSLAVIRRLRLGLLIASIALLIVVVYRLLSHLN